MEPSVVSIRLIPGARIDIIPMIYEMNTGQDEQSPHTDRLEAPRRSPIFAIVAR